MVNFEHFTDRAKKVLQLANQEAQRAGRERVDAEHLLLALLIEGRGVGACVLQNLGVNLTNAQAEVQRLSAAGTRSRKPNDQPLPFSAEATRALGRAQQESAGLNHRYVGTEHLLLALLHEEHGVASQTMRNLGLDFQAARDEVVSLLGHGTTEQAEQPQVEGSRGRCRIGIVGVSGYGGGELLRLCASHPRFEVTYVAGEASAGTMLGERFGGLPARLLDLAISRWDPGALPELELLFASLPTGQSRATLARVSPNTRIVDIGGDHRFVEGWTYGLADIWPDRIHNSTRVANPGCYPAAAITALAPLLRDKLIESSQIIIDAKSGISGAGRGGSGGSGFGFAELNEDLVAYGLLNHSHVPEMENALSQIGSSHVSVIFTPHLIPMTRGLLAACYARGSATTAQCLDSARDFYRDRTFVRIISQPPHTKWAAASNLAFVSYACDPHRGVVIALCAIDNLGKGAAGQAIQNANLMLDLPEDCGLAAAPLWP